MVYFLAMVPARARRIVPAAVMLTTLLGLAQQAYAESWQPWETVKGTSIAWRYRWDAAWKDYDVEVRNISDQAVTVKFVLSCGTEKSVGYWSLKPGATGNFIQDFSKGGLNVPLHLAIAEQTN